jgi:hypothetical protein
MGPGSLCLFACCAALIGSGSSPGNLDIAFRKSLVTLDTKTRYKKQNKTKQNKNKNKTRHTDRFWMGSNGPRL